MSVHDMDVVPLVVRRAINVAFSIWIWSVSHEADYSKNLCMLHNRMM